MHQFTRREVIFYCSLGLLVCIAVFFPDLYAAIHTRSGYCFSGIAQVWTNDANSYFAWVNQASNGHVLFSDLYTSAPSRGLFHPVFLLLGSLIRIFHIPVLGVWYGTRLVSTVVLLGTLAYFLRAFCGIARIRMAAYACIVFGGGFGWLYFNSADRLYPEATFMGTMQWPFIFAFALSLLLLSFMFLLRLLRERQQRFAVYGGLAALVLVFIHPYDVVTYCAVSAWALLVALISTARSGERLPWLRWLWLGIPLLGVAYYLYLFFRDPVFYASSQVSMRSPAPMVYIRGYLPLLLMALVGIYSAVRRKMADSAFGVIIGWLVVATILVYSPLSFQRRLMFGVIVPLGLLAAYGFDGLYRWIRQKRWGGRMLGFSGMIVIIVLIGGTAVSATVRDVKRLETAPFPNYIDSQTLRAITWLRANAHGGVVATSYEVGEIIPRFTGLHVVAGHWAQTINVNQKLWVLQHFYQGDMGPGEQESFLRVNRVSYVYYGPWERRLGGVTRSFEPSQGFDEAFRVGDTIIYRYRNGNQ